MITYAAPSEEIVEDRERKERFKGWGWGETQGKLVSWKLNVNQQMYYLL